MIEFQIIRILQPVDEVDDTGGFGKLQVKKLVY